MGSDAIRGTWLGLQSLFSRQRYRSVPLHRQQETESELQETGKKSPQSFLLASITREKHQSKGKARIDEDVTLIREQASDGELAAEDGTCSKPPKRSWIDGAFLCAKGSAVILILHLIFVAIVTGLASRYPDKRGFASGSVMYEGSCVLTKRWSIALHLMINLLSTCILGASNYCMQTLVAPTREDIDKAHAKRRWLDIGCSSLRNLLAMKRSRLGLWAVLLITATPFHLLYNSMIFEAVNTNEFGYIIAPRDISPDNIWNMTTPELEQCFVYPNYRIWGDMKWSDFATIIADKNYDHISTRECMSYFNQTNQRGIKALVALTPELSVSDGGNDAILSVQVLEGVPSSISTGESHGVDHFSTNGYAAYGDKIWGNGYSSDEITLHVDGGPVYYSYNISSIEDCVGEGGKRPACAHAGEVMGWVNSGSAKTIAGVRDYIDTHDIQDVKAENAITCGDSMRWDEYTIDGCLAVRAEQHCRLMYSPPICIVIALTTLAKVVAMFFAARITSLQSAPLLTFGDAVASFVANPDPTTVGMCWISSVDLHRGKWKNLIPPHAIGAESVTEDNYESATIIHKPLSRRKRWIQAPGVMRSSVTVILCLAFIAAGACLFQRAIVSDWLDYTSDSALSISLLREWWSEINSSTYSFIDSPGLQLPILNSVIVANIPQLILTICYYCYNSILTSMVAAAEYSSYGASRQSLRVTWPVKGSKQRSTYWLSIPYQYSVPILVMYTILHWLVSQSIFYVTLIPYRPGGQVDWGPDRLLSSTATPSGSASADPNSAYGGEGGQTVNSLAYSPLPLFVALLVGAFMLVVLVCLSFRKFKSDMPLAGACSAAISAACHPPQDENLETAAMGRLMWGETVKSPAWVMEQLGKDGGSKGHCCFTSLKAERPSTTKLYA